MLQANHFNSVGLVVCLSLAIVDALSHSPRWPRLFLIGLALFGAIGVDVLIVSLVMRRHRDVPFGTVSPVYEILTAVALLIFVLLEADALVGGFDAVYQWLFGTRQSQADNANKCSHRLLPFFLRIFCILKLFMAFFMIFILSEA